MEPKDKPCILCVDDEEEIRLSLKRCLRKLDANIHLAPDAKQALDFLSQHDVDVIISDMRMPGASGAELFQHVVTHYPDTYRIMLTGFADIESTIQAINLGRVHRFISKPWDNQQLEEDVKGGIEYARVKRENIRLTALVTKQNAALTSMNQDLEKQVKVRTKQIRAALAKIHKEQDVMHQMLFNFINVDPYIDSLFAKSVKRLANRIGEKMQLSEKYIDALKTAALMSEVGLLGVDNRILMQPFHKLNAAQREAYLQQVTYVDLILSPATHLNDVKDMIMSQYEHVDGSGFPNKLVADSIPLGSRIIAIARDFWRYVGGKLTGSKMEFEEAKKMLMRYKGTRYDPLVLNALMQIKSFDSANAMEQKLSTKDLKPGMILKANLYTDNHFLLLSAGHELTTSTIQKLKQFEVKQRKSLFLAIDETDNTAAQGEL